MIRYIMLFFILCLPLHAHEAEPLARAYGYVIGDILEQRVELTQDGEAIELNELPIEQRVGPWVRRLSAHISSDEKNTAWLTMRYQIINAPSLPQEVALPALNLPTSTADSFEVASQFIGLLPLTLEPKSKPNNLPFMLADKVPTLKDNRLPWRKLRYTLIALVSVAILWLAWWLWLRWNDRTTLPFSKALHKLHRLRKTTGHNISDKTEAWSSVHEAFNTLAGQTLSSRTAVSLLNGRAWLQPFSTDIEAFYKASDQRFFKPDTTPCAFDLIGFCQTLCKAEKRHAADAKSNQTRVA